MPSENFTFGDDAEERCVTYGFPEPQITWYLDDVAITRHASAQVVANQTDDIVFVSSTLTMTGLDKDDNGILKCTAVNRVGSDSEQTPFQVKCE